MKNQLNSKVFFVILTVIAVGVIGFTQVYAVENGGDDTSTVSSNVSNGNDDVSASANASVSNGGDDTSNTSGTGSVSNGDDDVAGSNTGGSVSNGDDDTQTPGTNNPGTTPGGNNPGSNTDDDDDNDGGNRRRGTNRNSNLIAVTPGTVVLSNSCPLITSPMLRRGVSNNSAEVAKLQAFLKNVEGLNVAVTGTFDAQTEVAVHAFQKKYATEVLLPWGGTKSSGIVYITTSKKINQMVCAQPLTLSAAELNIINKYRQNVINNRANGVNTSVGTDVIGGTQTGGTVAVGTTSTGTSTVEGNTNVASPVRTSLAARFWNFIVSLFR